MRHINLQEYAPSEYQLRASERDTLQEHLPSLTIQPVKGANNKYQLTPGSTVGALNISDLSVIIEPKIPIPQLLSLACYATGEFKPQEQLFKFDKQFALPDILALSLASAARRAFSRGLLHGYRVQEEALHTVRGRIRFGDQIKSRYGIALPVEVRYDEFTDDVLANRLVKAAVMKIGNMRLREPAARRELGWIAGLLGNISLVDFNPRSVPEIRFDRLNEHYREVIALSRLILSHNAYEARRGNVRASGFLMDMNKIFQEFLTAALREKLGTTSQTFRESNISTLDTNGLVDLRPDLTWWDGANCLFVGDAKYKKTTDGKAPNSDVYQLLAYVTALNLPGGMLIYAKGEEDPVIHKVRHTDKQLEIAALDLSGTLDKVLDRVHHLACRVKKLRDEAKTRMSAVPV